MHTTESSENYLETILILSRKLPVVRSVDIANELGFKKPSVSIAMKNLRENNYITMNCSPRGLQSLESRRKSPLRMPAALNMLSAGQALMRSRTMSKDSRFQKIWHKPTSHPNAP